MTMSDFPSFDDLRSDGGQQGRQDDADDDAVDAGGDAPRCVRDDCTGLLVDLLKLPGGRVVRDDSVPFSDAPAGVDGFVGCSKCHEPAEPGPGRSNPGGDGDDGGV